VPPTDEGPSLAQAKPPPAPLSPAPPAPTPPPSVPTPSNAPAQSVPLPTPVLPTPPVPTPPLPSVTAQPHPTKNPVPDTDALNNTLEKLRALQKQKDQPKAKANPAQGGAPDTGGVKTSDITDELTAAQRTAIGDKVRECWTKDPGALDLEKMEVMLTVTVDAEGVARKAEIGDEDRARVGFDPRLRAFAERAIRAVLSARCSTFTPWLPKADLGHTTILNFRFRP
jgi:hypothetical protein